MYKFTKGTNRMIIQHNLPALNANRVLGITNRRTAGNLEKLSSGFRVNRAADDAAGLAISEKMRGQIRGLNMAHKNIQHGISLIQTAEGALHETHAILQRMRELAVQSSNGTYMDEIDRQGLESEYQSMMRELNRIAESTHFNNIKLLDGRFARAFETNVTAPVTPSASQHMAASVMAPSPLNMPAQLTPPTGTATFSVNTTWKTVTITGNGVFDISNYSGYDITIATTATDVRLTQTGRAQVTEVSIICSAKSNGNGTNLFVDNLNILNTQSGGMEKSAIEFYGGGNTLNLMGTNNFELRTTNRNSTDSPSNHSVINVYRNAELTINDALGFTGILNATISNANPDMLGNVANGAVIGGQADQGPGKITIAGGSINARNLTSQSGGAAIGGGKMSFDSAGWEIAILGGTVYAQVGNETGGHSAPNGAAIGGGSRGAAGNITITGGTVTAVVIARNSAGSPSDSQGAAIGSGYGAATNGSSNILITGGTVVARVDSYIAESAVIGGGSLSVGGNITITGGDVTAIINSPNQYGATIGGGGNSGTVVSGQGGDGANIEISGGIVRVENGWIGGGYSNSTGAYGANGTTHITGGTLVIDDPSENIMGGVTTAAGQYGYGLNAEQLYRVAVLPAEIGFDLPADTLVQFVVNDTSTYSWKTDPYPYQGGMYLYLPDETAGATTRIDIIVNGEVYKGYAKVQADHSAIWTPYDGDIDPDPDDPDPVNPDVNPPQIEQVGGLVLQIGANSPDILKIYIEDMRIEALGVEPTSIETREKANCAIGVIDKAVALVSQERSSLGAYQNRLESIWRSNMTANENLTAAESSIRDADIAKEMIEFTRNSILVRSAQSMLAQANQLPQIVLELLR